RVVMGFVDSQVCDLLGVDWDHEGPLELISVGMTDEEAPEAPEMTPRNYRTKPLS
ncbi:MAG: dehydrogenase, partial [Halobacteria archaeon]|nr:dehydrogenase [Halobacteria archaeon]